MLVEHNTINAEPAYIMGPRGEQRLGVVLAQELSMLHDVHASN
jgi:hypothetical protein